MSLSLSPLWRLWRLGGLLLFLALPAHADDWQVTRKGQSGVFVQRYKRLLEMRLKMDFNFKRLLQLYEPKGGALELITEYEAKAKAQPDSHAFRVILGHLNRHVGKADVAVGHYREAQRLAPNEYIVAFSLAEGLAAARDNPAAEKAYEAAFALAKKEDEKRDCLLKMAALAL